MIPCSDLLCFVSGISFHLSGMLSPSSYTTMLSQSDLLCLCGYLATLTFGFNLDSFRFYLFTELNKCFEVVSLLT